MSFDLANFIEISDLIVSLQIYLFKNFTFLSSVVSVFQRSLVSFPMLPVSVSKSGVQRYDAFVLVPKFFPNFF